MAGSAKRKMLIEVSCIGTLDEQQAAFPHPPAPSPTERGRGGASVFTKELGVNHGVKAPRPRHGRGVGVRGADNG